MCVCMYVGLSDYVFVHNSSSSNPPLLTIVFALTLSFVGFVAEVMYKKTVTKEVRQNRKRSK